MIFFQFVQEIELLTIIQDVWKIYLCCWMYPWWIIHLHILFQIVEGPKKSIRWTRLKKTKFRQTWALIIWLRTYGSGAYSWTGKLAQDLKKSMTAKIYTITSFWSWTIPNLWSKMLIFTRAFHKLRVLLHLCPTQNFWPLLRALKWGTI